VGGVGTGSSSYSRGLSLRPLSVRVFPAPPYALGSAIRAPVNVRVAHETGQRSLGVVEIPVWGLREYLA